MGRKPEPAPRPARLRPAAALFRSASLANSTIRIAFFAARPISMTSPICEYTSFSICTM